MSNTPDINEPYAAISTIQAQIGYLEGEILTLVDATFADAEQRKAFKDIIKDRFRAKLRWIEKLCYNDIETTTTSVPTDTAPVTISYK